MGVPLERMSKPLPKIASLQDDLTESKMLPMVLRRYHAP